MHPAYVAVLTLFAAPFGSSLAAADRNLGDSLKEMFDIRTTVENSTAAAVADAIPGYMYELYEDIGNLRYDVIRGILPRTESLGSYTSFVYDLDALEPTEIVQKAVLQLEQRPIEKAINVSFYVFPAQTLSKKYLGTASIHGTLDLAGALGSKLLAGLDQLVVRIEGPVKPSIGLVLYSVTTGGRFDKGHELSKLLLETKTLKRRRRRRSVADNEIEQNNFSVDLKRKKKKKKGSRAGKLQAIDTGDTITITDRDQCRMEKLVLDFADIGWEDWVIYPKGFETNYCSGGCLYPLGKGSRPSNHATVQSLARSFGRLWDVPEPSCVPETLAPLTLLYMDRNNHVLLKSYPDMRVLTCACK